MYDDTTKTYWKSADQRVGAVSAGHHPESIEDGPSAINRRTFLEVAGFSVSLAAVSGCGRAPIEKALPFVDQPEGIVPGRMRSYASTCAGCAAGCGLLVSVRDGRPLKMEGMPEHPLSRGGLCAIGQALPLGLYDRHRLSQPLHNGKLAEWEAVDEFVTTQLQKIARDGGAVRLVTPTVTSPTLKAAIDSFLSDFSDGRHVTFDSVSSSAILDAHQETHGIRVLPHFKLDQARVIVSFGADFLGTWISPVEFTAAWRVGRGPTADRPEMSHHAHFEGRMSLTGSNADKRYRLAPDEYGVVLSHLAVKLSDRANQPRPEGALSDSPIPDVELAALADRLWKARGACVVLCDSQDIATQRLVNFVNQTLGNYGRTLDLERPSRQRQGDDAAVLQLVEELKAGDVSALVVAGTDLTHNLPDRDAIVAAIGELPLTVSFADRLNDIASLADVVCPDHHPLEAWMDAEPVSGVVSLSQPTLEPLGQTRSILESLDRWSSKYAPVADPQPSGRESMRPELSLIQSHWQAQMLPRTERQSFQSFWDQVLHDGVVELEAQPTVVGEFQSSVVTLVAAPPAERGHRLVLYSKVGLTDSHHAHNPWLQELPDPVTKVTWDNYVCVSPAIASQLDLTDGDVVRVEVSGGSLELPALVQLGQHDQVLAIALGYGVKGTDRFAKIGPQWLEARPTVAAGQLVGKNAAAFVETRDGSLHFIRTGVLLTKTGRRHQLASTQSHHSLEVPAHVAPHGAEVREPIQETTLSAFAEDPHAGTPQVHHDTAEQLWTEDHPKTGHHWGMVIDLNKCTGCSACLIACQSENNVPVVGKDEVRRQREMHWIRVDRYYSGAEDEIDVVHQPMMCQHCDNAPCETVCPVLATVHGEEGLNEQVYNRCVGTRYCANNCPYKVRRFNWFTYNREDSLQNLVLNPDVTVRSRGVMEKCSMCVQRIEVGKLEAKRRGLALESGEIQTACQQSCPAQAITFGDLNNDAEPVHSAFQSPRRFGVLEEFNFRPSVSYLRAVRNREPREASVGEVDSHSPDSNHGDSTEQEGHRV